MAITRQETETNILDGANLVLGLVLLASPWLVGFENIQMAVWSAGLGGLLIAAVAAAALARWQTWEEWVNIALGLAVLVSPWVLGFSGASYALWTHVAVGLAVAVLAAIDLWMAQGNSPRAV